MFKFAAVLRVLRNRDTHAQGPLEGEGPSPVAWNLSGLLAPGGRARAVSQGPGLAHLPGPRVHAPGPGLRPSAGHGGGGAPPRLLTAWYAPACTATESSSVATVAWSWVPAWGGQVRKQTKETPGRAGPDTQEG
jgi:hypothetical protein